MFSKGDFHPLYSLYKSKSLWLASYKDKKRNYIKKLHKKISKVESAKTEENSHHAWVVRILKVLYECCASFAQASHKLKVLCEFRTSFAQAEGVVRISHKPGAVVFRRLYLPHFSSKSYTVWSVGFLTSWSLKCYIACRKWTLRSAPKVPKKTAAAVLYFPPCFSLLLFAFLLWMACLNDPKSCQNTKTSHKYD